MRFALLGNHPDALALTAALIATGRHELVAYSGPPEQRITTKLIGDLEELLADPVIEAVIVAGPSGVRTDQLRRALQSERHVLCVHPADPSPDIAYEAALIQSDTRQVLLPILPNGLHPGIVQLAGLIQKQDSPLGRSQLVIVEYTSTSEISQDGAGTSVPGWNILRVLLGELAEVSAFAVRDSVQPGDPLLVAGRSETGVLFQVTLLPHQLTNQYQVRVHATHGWAELTLAPGGETILKWRSKDQEIQSQSYAAWEPWPTMVAIIEAAIGYRPSANSADPLSTPIQADSRKAIADRPMLTWQDEIRCLELDDAARRSVERRRASTLEYQEVSEEVGFKGTMTLIGCALMWGLLLLVILAAWQPLLLWAVIPLLSIFLGLQLLRWIIPAGPNPPDKNQPDS